MNRKHRRISNIKWNLVHFLIALMIVVTGLSTIAFSFSQQKDDIRASNVQQQAADRGMPSSTLPSTSSSPTQSPVIPTATTKTFLALDPFAGPRITPTPAPTEPGVAIQGWSMLKLPADADEADVALYNPEENEDWYYLTFALYLIEDDEPSDEALFQTGLIPPGQYCNKVILNHPLKSGTYDAILHVQPYYMNESQLPTNNLNLDIRLLVE